MTADPFKNLIVRRRKGEMVFLEGDQGSEMYVIQTGSVRIYREVDGARQELALMEKGDFFGEISVLEGLPRTTSAEAVEDTELIEISSTTFDKMIRGNIEIAVRMLRKLSNRLLEANRKLESMARLATGDRFEASPITAVDLDLPGAAPPSSPGVPADAAPRAAPRSIDEVDVPSGALGLLVLENGEHDFPLITDTAIIGRYDPVTGSRPEIDLTQVDISRSVSRRHARILVQDGSYFILEEVGALNGTRVNGERLVPGKPSPIHSGDKVALGMVSLIFKAADPKAEKAARTRS